MIKGIAHQGKIHYLTDTTSSKSIIDLVWPVGSIYITINTTFNPANTFGGTWVKIEEGRYLRAVTNNKVGQKVEAGLPNITGSITTTFMRNADGAFYGTQIARAWRGTTETNMTTIEPAYFDASRSSAVYGKSNTVQPASINVIMWQRTA